MKRVGLFAGLFVLLGLVVYWVGSPRVATAEWQGKVDAWILETAETNGETEFIVFLAEQADVSGAYALDTKLEKGTYVFEQLTTMADATQGSVLAELNRLGVEHRAYWVANMIWVRGDRGVVEAMASRPDVAHLYANPTVKMEDPLGSNDNPLESQPIEWNIEQVNAPDVWAEGVTGEGVVVGGHDTGYEWDHPALINQYRGWDGATADHNYHWHDAIHEGGSDCGADSPVPCDDNNHGTHTMGTMVGDDGGNNQIGMAPGARWIGCRNMNEGNGTPTTYSECYQWFIAPTDLNGLNPDPAMAPHVINNSWSCPESEGCTDPNAMLTVVQNVVAAGIVTAHSAGNGGSQGCNTINAPSAIYDESFTVGSTTSADTISGFSSRGSVTVDGSGRLKPDITAPGSGVRSSVRNGGYSSFSGTSMAAPHVAGLVALLISASPDLAGDVATIETLIQDTALPLTTTENCGGIPGNNIPNNTYGWGRIDALNAATNAPIALSVSKTGLATAMSGMMMTYRLEVKNNHPFSMTTNVVFSDVIPAGTSFVTATLPHTFDGTTVIWNTASLNAQSSASVELTVAIPEGFYGTITNSDYGAFSDDVAYVAGMPVVTEIMGYTFVPIINKP